MEAMMDEKMKDLKEQLELDHQRSLESKIAQILDQQVLALAPLAGAEHGSCKAAKASAPTTEHGQSLQVYMAEAREAAFSH